MPPSPTAPTRDLVRLKAAAAYADVNERTLRRWIANGQLTGYRRGQKLILVDLAEVDAITRPLPTVGTAA